jgi:hypothetical protein
MSDERPPIARRGQQLTCPSGHVIATVAKDFWQLRPLLARFFVEELDTTKGARCPTCGDRWFRARELMICIDGQWIKSSGVPA